MSVAVSTKKTIIQIPGLNAALKRASGFPAGSIVGGRGAIQSQQAVFTTTSVNQQVTYQTRHTIQRDCTDIQLLFSNSYDGEALPQNSIRLKTGIQIFGTSTVYPLLFNGLAETVIEPGGYKTSDPIGLELAAGTLLTVRSRPKGTNIGDVWGLGKLTYTVNYEGSTADVDLTNANILITAVTKSNPAQLTTGTTKHNLSTGDKIYITGASGGAGWSGLNSSAGSPRTVTVIDAYNFTIPVDSSGFTGSYTVNTGYVGGVSDYNNVYCYQPTAILGTASPYVQPTVIIIGDSIAFGYPNNGSNSFIDRAIDSVLPSVSIAVSGEELSGFVSVGGHLRRGFFMGLATLAIIQYGTNDIKNGRSVSATQANFIEISRVCDIRGISKKWVCTIPPLTTSTDSFATAGNQTPGAYEANRVSMNNLLRANYRAWGFEYLIDVCSVCEVNSSNVLTQNGGRWLTNGVAFYPTPEGVHPSNAICDLMATLINPSLAKI